MKIEVLDCTLRDGGYCNNWEFGLENINYIVKKLLMAKVEIVEIGFISDEKEETKGNTIFRSTKKIKNVLPKEKRNTKLVCMCNYGEVNFEQLEPQEETGIDGIRLAFHKNDWKSALELSKKIKEKGYDLYLQPMVTMNYQDKELLELVFMTNEIEPIGFYIVDSFGVVRQEELLRMYYLINHNLNKNIKIGYHSHNNMQLSYANSSTFISIQDERDKIIDASVFGMGRGAGNLNTELFVEHLNRCYLKNYAISPLLQIIDNVLNKIYCNNYWGYSLPHYLSAKHNCHPNYASYLSNKNTLNTESINAVLERIPEEYRCKFNKKLIEILYLDYQNNDCEDFKDVENIGKSLKQKKVVLIAPGRNYRKYISCIAHEMKKTESVVISVNFIPRDVETDFVFISNQKRYEQFVEEYKKYHKKLIVTSNLLTGEQKNIYKINYNSVRNNTSFVEDNAMLMLLQLLVRIGIREVYIAGMDGYSDKAEENYFDSQMTMNTEKKYVELMNKGIADELNTLSEFIQYHWITPTIFEEEREWIRN